MVLSASAKKVVLIGAAVVAAVAAYKLLTREEKEPVGAIKRSASVAIKAAAKAAEAVIDVPAKIIEKPKRSHKKKGSKAHKGHATKRGLAQDQAMISKEAWEKTYRKDHPRRK